MGTKTLSRALCVLVATFSLGAAGCGGSSKAPSKKTTKAKAKPKAKPTVDSYRVAIDLEAAEDFVGADKAYQTALRKRPTHDGVNQHYVHFLIDRGRPRVAVQVAQRYHDAVTGRSVTYHTLADAAAALGNHELVVATMTGLMAFDDEDPSAYEKRGRARIAAGERTDGVRDLRRAFNLDPDNDFFLFSLGSGLVKAGKSHEAKKLFRKTLKEDPENVRAYVLLGLLARSQGKVATARKHHEKAAKLDPNDPRTFFELGITLNMAGDNAGAEASLGHAVELTPENGTYWYAYGDLLRIVGRTEESAAAYRESTRLKPGNAGAWEKLGLLLIETDQLSSASKQLKKGLATVHAPRLHYLLAQVYSKVKQEEQAIASLKAYLKAAAADASDRQAAEALLQKLSH